MSTFIGMGPKKCSAVLGLFGFLFLNVIEIAAQAPSFPDAATYDAWKAQFVPAHSVHAGTELSKPVAAGKPKGGGSGTCDCWIAPDASYTTINNNSQWNASGFQSDDDGSFGPITLPFQFYLYGQFWNTAYININGNVSFGTWYTTFSSTGFPINDFTMVAPFWADVDLGGPGAGNNIVQYKVTPTALYVNWTNVGYYNEMTDKVNTFQLVITDGSDPVVPNGANVSFCYQDMQWTTGSASQGTNGFGGTPASVGANHGNGIDYLQFGRFDQPGVAYDGPFGLNDGVDWLDGQYFSFSTDITTGNVPPVVSGQSICDTLVLCVGQTAFLNVTFLSPEPGQTTVPSASAPTLNTFNVVNAIAGQTAFIEVEVIPAIGDTGFHFVTFEGTDDGTPVLTSTVDIVLLIQPSELLPDTSVSFCSYGPSVDLFTMLAGDPDPGGTWIDPLGNVHSGTFVPGTSLDGEYEYSASVPGFCTQIGRVEVTTYDLNNTAQTTDVSCHGLMDGLIEISTIGNGGPWNYSWTDDQGNAIQTTPNAVMDEMETGAGSFAVVVMEGSNGNACSDTLVFVIAEPDEVEITALTSDTVICRNGTALMAVSVQGGVGTISYDWSHGASMSSEQVSPLNTTFYSVYAFDGNGCSSDTLEFQVTVRPPLNFALIDTVFSCPEVDVTLSPFNVTGGDGSYAFDWGNGPSHSPDHTVNLTTSQNLCMTLSDGCETTPVTRCIRVEIIPIPELIVTVDSALGCEPFAVRFALEDTTGGAQIEWDFGDGVSTPGPDSVGHTYADPGGYDLSVVVTWPNGCMDDTTVVDMVIVEPLPDANFTWSPLPVSVLLPEVDFEELAGPYAVTYDWDFAGLGGSQEPDPTFWFPGELGASYPVTLLVTNALGCPDSVTKLVEVRDELMVYVPNTFTPDGDGINDFFFVNGNDISALDFELIIFDRWGQVVFETEDPAEPWNGTLGNGGGDVLMSGVYAWKLRTRSAYSKEKREWTGHVNLLK
ncbi:MAG: gliding motility-associated C-terminal domain-containing protein [Flavobacteriales bacterium]|nr:gliding motility-associated C-terminal domain-containing protein [Flavobacteriales bacterium]